MSSLAFALEHAAAHRMKRVIYVIPYTSIIEQTAETFRRIVGEGNVVEHHANVDFDQRDDSDGGAERLRLAAENWDAPLIVTTSVQFFESLYANKPSRCRKLHNIAGSVVIFDEAQMIPIPHLKPCVRAIETLVRDYGATAVLCTATQPALEPFFSPGLQPREICGDPGLYEFFRRTEIRRIGRRTTAQLADDMARHRQVLAIVNTKQQAADLYGQLPEEGRFHLSTRMTPEDRQKTLGRIRQRLQQGAVCRVAATSLVEAGVDVDFPAVYRAEAGLDSIIQAAGRCNRENKRPREQSIVSVFQPEGRPPTAIAQNTAIFHEIAACGRPLDAPETIRAYFEALHQFKGEELDTQGVVAAFDRGIRGNRLPFATVAADFRMIDTDTRSILIPLGPAARQCAAALRAGTATRRQLRQAGRHMVAVYPQQFAHLVALGAAEPVGEMAILCDLSLYDHCTGLAVDPVQGQAVFF